MSYLSAARQTFIEMFIDGVVAQHPELAGDDKREGLRHLVSTISGQTCTKLVAHLTPILEADADKASEDLVDETIEGFRYEPRRAARACFKAAYCTALSRIELFASAAPEALDDVPFTSSAVGKA